MSKDQINELAADIYSMLRVDAMSRALASLLYGNGWRKQSEGEWIDVEDTFLYRYKCSLCGEIKLGKMTNFCPNCGAKMKGENE